MTLLTIRQAMTSGLSCEELVQRCIDHMDRQPALAAKVFTRRLDDQALAQARAYDRLRAQGVPLPPYAGVPISIKDLFDMAGEVTTCGSRVLADNPPAQVDADVVRRLRNAGFIPVGRTNMSEFAYSGLGLNPHYGTPENPWERADPRIPGGSSSGAAVAITDQMAIASLGTDTGGSCRIPAALCGVVGFKPTAANVSRRGVAPLSSSLDSVGPLGASVECVAILNDILCGDACKPLFATQLKGLRLALPQTLVLEGIDSRVAAAFERTLACLSDAGVHIEQIALPELGELAGINAKGGFAAAEAWAWHRELIATKRDGYDPNVVVRIEKGRLQSAADYIDLLQARADLQQRVAALSAPFDALIMPTVPTVAPRLEDMADPECFAHTNLLMLRNPSLANFLDRCAISLPCHAPGEAPVGVMLMGEHGHDRRLLSIAWAVEALLARTLRG
ncbi:amidase [Pseudomonas japonica]|uniref:amidase n=1 Tax=Pseudomonas japonica TaxID=256466 RepID=UPI00380040B7